MIRVCFTQKPDTLSLTVKGHAGQAAAGHDLVCAAASVLTYTAAQAVQTLYEEGKLAGQPALRLENGDAVIVCRPTDAAFAEALHAYTVVQTGFALLAQHYPAYIRVTVFGQA